MSEGETPPLGTWQSYRDWLDRANRSQAWSTVANWAIDVLEEELGTSWPRTAAEVEMNEQRGLPLVSGLKALGWHAVGLVETLEWAIRLRLVRDLDGAADLRNDLIGNVMTGRILHTDLQLQIAGLALRRGWKVQLEPMKLGCERPADLLLTTPNAGLLVEARVVSEAVADRDHREWTDQAIARVMNIAAANRTWLEGDLGDALDERTVAELERRIPIEAPSALLGHEPELRIGATRLRLVRQDDAKGQLTVPGASSDLWPRMTSAIAKKAEQMAASGADWLRLIPYNNFFLLTRWAQLPLAEKLEMLEAQLRSSLAGRLPAGVAISSGAGLQPGPISPETIRHGTAVAMRRQITPLRARETHIIPIADTSPEAADAWRELADAEANWLPWALARFELPDLSEILASP